jgi:hypothetical protein
LRIKNKRAVSRTLLSALIGLLIIGLGLGIGSIYGIQGLIPGSHSHPRTTTTTPQNSFPAPDSISLSCSPATVVIGSQGNSTCVATISGANTPTGTVSWESNDSGTFSPNKSCSLSSGSSCSVNFKPSSAGDASINASYSGDSKNKIPPSFAIFNLGVARAASQTVVICASISSVGEPSKCTATVSGYRPSDGSDVSFTASGSGSFDQSTCTLSARSCSVNYTPLNATPQNITASYQGDANNNASLSAPFLLRIGARSSSTSISCSPSSIPIGSSTTCTVFVTGFHPIGTVAFSSTDTNATFSPSSCSLLILSNSQSWCEVTYTPSLAGTANLTAIYSGDRNNLGSYGSTLVTATQNSSSSVSVACNPSTVTVGQASSCSATVSGYKPKGTVSWQSTGAGTFSSNTCTSSSGKLICQVTYTPSAAGLVTITATYSGDHNNPPGSGTFVLSVAPFATSMNVSCPPSVANGSSVTCTVTINGYNLTGSPSWKTSGNGTLSPGSCAYSSNSISCSANYTASNDIPGSSVTITASYPGDTNNQANTASATLQITSNNLRGALSNHNVGPLWSLAVAIFCEKEKAMRTTKSRSKITHSTDRAFPLQFTEASISRCKK